MHDISNFPLFIVGTYRNDEVDDYHSLNKFKNEYAVNDIYLDLFDKIRMSEFVSKLIYESKENISELSDFITQKSKGNPFFAIEILKQLINEKALLYENRKWNVKNEVLSKIDISIQVVDILLKRISLLDDKAKSVLSYAAVIGRKFEIELLFYLFKKSQTAISEKGVVEIVDKAIQLQLLEEDLQDKGKIFCQAGFKDR